MSGLGKLLCCELAGIAGDYAFAVDINGDVHITYKGKVFSSERLSKCATVLGCGIVVRADDRGGLIFTKFDNSKKHLVPDIPTLVNPRGVKQIRGEVRGKDFQIVKVIADPADLYRCFVLRANHELEIVQLKDDAAFSHIVFTNVTNFEVTKRKYLIESDGEIAVYERNDILFDPLWKKQRANSTVSYLMDELYVYEIDRTCQTAHVLHVETGKPKMAEGGPRVIDKIVWVSRSFDGSVPISTQSSLMVNDDEILRRDTLDECSVAMKWQGAFYFWGNLRYPVKIEANEHTQLATERDPDPQMEKAFNEHVANVKAKVTELTLQIQTKMELLLRRGQSLENKVVEFLKRVPKKCS